MIQSFLMSVVAVCMISVVALSLVQGNTMRRVIRFVGGLLLLLVVARPLLSFDLAALAEQFALPEGVFDTEAAKETYESRLREHIISTTEDYIEEKAAQLGADIQARVTLSEGELPVPQTVCIVGMMSTEQKEALHEYLSQSLGITQEEWKLYE